MGEFVGVDPANLKELASRLQRLHDVLAQHGPTIQQKMQKWGSDVSFASLPRLINEALDDARDMEARRTRAYELANEKGWSPIAPGPITPGSKVRTLSVNTVPAPIVQLDWATTGQSGYQAQQDAAQLSKLLTDPATLRATYGRDKEVIRDALEPLAEKLRSHLNDKAYLATFWESAAPLASRLAKALHDNSASGDPLLSKADTAIVAAFGAALAAATRLRTASGSDIGKGGKTLLSDSAKSALKSGDPWSVGMLVKYGPNGKSWDAEFLADITRFMLDTRKSGKITWPTFHKQIKSDADANRYQRALAEFDAVGAVLDRAAENGKTARHVLGNPTSGLAYTRMLVNHSWHTPGYDAGHFMSSYLHPGGSLPPQGQIDVSSHTAAFLKAAVSAHRGTTLDAKESAWSVVNIVKSTSEFAAAHPDTILPAEIRKALFFTANRYIPDFAQGITREYGSIATSLGDVKGNPWVAIANRSELERFFDQGLQDPKEFGVFKGLSTARLAAATTATIKGPSDENFVREIASLYGVIQCLETTREFVDGQKRDEEATRNQIALSALTGGFGALSFNNTWGPGTIAQFLTGTATPFINDAFDTDHALKALEEKDSKFRSQMFGVEVPIVQGLINAGALHPPGDAEWFKDGRVVPHGSLTTWLSTHGDTVYAGKRLDEWVDETKQAMGDQK